jgi:hypothetical protein
MVDLWSHQESQRSQLADNRTRKGNGAKSEGWTMRANAKLLDSPSIIQIGDHMANESREQKIYDTLRRHVSARLVRAMDIVEGDLANLSLGELINTLFLMHGDSGSTGNFSVTFSAALKIVGSDLMWQESAANKAAIVEPAQRVHWWSGFSGSDRNQSIGGNMTTKRNSESHKYDKQAAAGVMFDALVRLEEKLLTFPTLDNFDREILTIIGPALNAARGVRESHSADF